MRCGARAGETRVLRSGFVYDALVVEPSGATSGGTRVVVRGDGTRFGSSAAVTGGAPCTDVVVASPASSPAPPARGAGAKDVAVSGAGEPCGREAYTYSIPPTATAEASPAALSGRAGARLRRVHGRSLEGATAIAGRARRPRRARRRHGRRRARAPVAPGQGDGDGVRAATGRDLRRRARRHRDSLPRRPSIRRAPRAIRPASAEAAAAGTARSSRASWCSPAASSSASPRGRRCRGRRGRRSGRRPTSSRRRRAPVGSSTFPRRPRP